MKLRIVSDLHIDSWSLPFVLPELPTDSETVLIIAGDAGEQCKATKHISEWCERFRKVVYVMGNHEYYKGSTIRTPVKIACAVANHDLHILQRDELIIDDAVIIGATLWTDFDKESPFLMWDARQSMNDYRHIRTGGQDAPYARKFQPIDALATHKQHLEYIKDRVAHWTEHNAREKTRHNKRIVVVTHHAPSYQSVGDRFQGSRLNGCYASDLDSYVENSNIELWIHGHMHDRKSYKIGDTRIICNPRGYVTKHEAEDTGFDPNLLVEL